jgi:hypothetical protein
MFQFDSICFSTRAMTGKHKSIVTSHHVMRKSCNRQYQYTHAGHLLRDTLSEQDAKFQLFCREWTRISN